ncbi:MAG: hypothetical protein OXP36_00820 [Gammaproteobacteria bacterium]|nr:hypothetical protein [Gammaproteobacteria bacterium]
MSSSQIRSPDVPHASIAAEDIATLAELREMCPDPWTEGVPDDCSAALAGRYGREGMRMVRPPYDGGGWEPPPAPLPVEVPWEEAFTDVAGARRAVKDALGKPECAAFILYDSKEKFGIADGRDVEATPQLREVCAADGAARLAMVHAGCVKLLRRAGRLDLSLERHPDDEAAAAVLRERDSAYRHEANWVWAVEHLDDDPTLTLEEYWRRRDEIEDERFRFAWRRLMCRAVPPEAFALLDALPEPGHDIHQGHHLRRYAARLGNEWALAVAERNEEEVWGPVD